MPVTLTYTLQSLPTSSILVRKVIWASGIGLFVAVGTRSGNTGPPGGDVNRVMTSPDGITWTVRAAAQAYDWSDVAYSPSLNKLCAVTGSTLTTVGANITDQVMTSTDGITWTPQTSSQRNQWQAVVWADSLNLFVAVSNSGVNRVMTSPDGVTWTNRSAAAANSWNCIAWGGSTLVAASISGSTVNAIMISTDGSAWSAQATPSAATFTDRALAYSSTLGMFAIAATSSKLFTSTNNGATWVNWSGPPSGWPTQTGQLIWSPEWATWLGASRSFSSKLLKSADGITWTAAEMDDGSTLFVSSWRTIAYSPSLQVAVLMDFNATTSIPIIRITAGLPPPTVLSISALKGYTSGGQRVTITGSSFVSGATVTFGGVAATNVVFVSDTTLRCTTGAHAVGTVDVVVTNPDANTGTLAAAFTYVVLSVAPLTGSVSGGTLVTITGAGFSASTVVTFDGIRATNVIVANEGQLTCITPKRRTAGAVSVVVI